VQSLAIFAHSLATATGGKTWIFAGIALAACILGIEIACIVILIRKMISASRIRRAEEDEGDWGGSAYAAALLLPAITFSAETVLAALVLLCALASLVLAVLVVVFRSLGYDFVSAELLKAQREKLAAERANAPQPMPEEPTPVVEKAETVEEEPDALSVFDDVPATVEAEQEAADTDEQDEPVPEAAEETVAETEDTPVEDFFAEDAETVEETVAQVSDDPIEALAARMASAAQSAPSNQPTRIVQIEKQYTETVKEVAAPAAQTSNDTTATDRLIEKLTDLIDKMDRKTEEAAAAAVANEESVAVAAAVSLPADEDEDEDDLVDPEEDSASARDEDGEDGDEESDGDDRFTGNERIIGFDEATGCYIIARYRKSFEAKLIQSRPNIKQYYSELKNALLAYKGTKSRISWTADSFHNGRTSIAKINVKTRILEIYLALDPASLEGTVYRGRDVGKLKKYADTPFQYKVRTPRKFKWAMELVQRVCEEQGLTPIDVEKVDYEAAYPFEDTDSLVSRGLIKEYIREEKPASTFELDENHVPVLPDEDETVIPANANILWEFDNEELSKKEPEPTVEPLEESEQQPEQDPEPEVASAPIAEPVAEEPAVLRETTKVTQVRYTEQYFGDSDTPVTYKEFFTGDGPLTDESIFAVASETVEETAEVAEEVADEEAAYESVEESEETYEETELSEDYRENEETEEEYTEESDESGDEEDLDWEIPAGLTLETDETTEALYDEEYTEESYEGEEEYTEEAYEGEEEYTEEAYEGEEEYAEEAYEGEKEYAEEAYEGEEEYTEESYEGEEEYTEEAYEGEEEYTEEAYEGEEEYAEEAYEGEEEYAEEAYEGEEEYEEIPVEDEPTARINVNPDVALVGVSVLEENFEAGEEIDLAALKARGLVLPSAKSLKIYVGGTLTKAFTVVADQFTMEAIFAISAAGGEPQMIRK
jgi:topoisomerase-4 subunit A